MFITNRERKRYLKSISRLLLCGSKERTQFLQDFNSNIDEFLAFDKIAAIGGSFFVKEALEKAGMN